MDAGQMAPRAVDAHFQPCELTSVCTCVCVCARLCACAQLGRGLIKEKPEDVTAKAVVRPYTPTTPPDTRGHLDLIVKVCLCCAAASV